MLNDQKASSSIPNGQVVSINLVLPWIVCTYINDLWHFWVLIISVLIKLQYPGTQASEESIRDRERELEKIHRRSRELMLSPRSMETENNHNQAPQVDGNGYNINGTC